MIRNSGENNPFDSLDKISSQMDSGKMNEVSNEIEESRNIYDKCSEFLEKTVLDIISQSPTSLTQPQSIQDIIQVIDLTNVAKKQVSKLVDFNDLLKNEEPGCKEEKQHKLEQKTKQINELLKSEIGALDNAIQEEMKKAVDEMTISMDTSRNVNKLIECKTTNRSIYENPTSRLTFFTFKSIELDKMAAENFNKLDELLPKAKERIRQLPIIFQNEMFDLILSQTYTLTHLKLIENHLKYFESISNLKDSSQIDLIFKLFEGSIPQNINDKTSTPVETRQKVVDLFALAENPEQIESLIQTLTHPDGKINPIAAQYLKHTIIKEPLSKVIDNLKTLKNSLPSDFKSEISEWEKLSALLTQDPQLFQLMITHYQNNHETLDYFLRVFDEKSIDLKWFIDEIEKMPLNLSASIQEGITTLSRKEFNVVISLWKKVGYEIGKGSITQLDYANTLKKMIALAKEKSYLLESLQGLNSNESELLYRIISKNTVNDFSLIRIINEFVRMNKAALFDELSENFQSYNDFKKLFLINSNSLLVFKKTLADYLGKNIEHDSVDDIYAKIDPSNWPMISRLASFDPPTRQEILESNKNFTSIQFFSKVTKIYEQSPLVGGYFLEFHKKYPNHSGILSDLLFKIDPIRIEKLLKKQDTHLDEHIKLLLSYVDLSKAEIDALLDFYDLNPSLCVLCLTIPPEKGREIVKIIPEILGSVSTQMINEWIKDPVFLSHSVEFLSNHRKEAAICLKKILGFKNFDDAKLWVSFFQFDHEGIVLSEQRCDFFELALPLLADSILHVPPAFLFSALKKIEKDPFIDFTLVMKNYHESMSHKVRNILDVIQMGEMGLASILCQEALEPNRVPKDIKEKVLYHLSEALNSTAVPFYQELMRLDLKRDEKLLLWIENSTKNEPIITQEIMSLLRLHEQGEDKLVNDLLAEIDPNKSTNIVMGLLQTVRKKITFEAADNTVRRETLVKCIKKGETALATYIFAKKPAFWEIDQSGKRLTNSLRVQESLWNLVDDYTPKELPLSLEKYLKMLLSSNISEKECILALGYLQHIIKQDPTQIEKLIVFKSVEDLEAFVINCPTTNPRSVFLKMMPSAQEMRLLSPIDKEKFIEYRSTVALAKCIVTARGSLNTALLPHFIEEIFKIGNIAPNSSFAKHLNHIFTDFTKYREEYTQVLQKLIDPVKDKQQDMAELIVRSIEQKKTPELLTKMDYLESVVSAVLSQSRQADNRGNCFAMQTMIMTESDHKGLINSLKDYVELLSKDKLIRNNIREEYPLIIDQESISRRCTHPLQSSRAYTVAQMFAPWKLRDSLFPSLEVLNTGGLIGQHIDSILVQTQTGQNTPNLQDLQESVYTAINATFVNTVNTFYSLDVQVPGQDFMGAWLLKNRYTGIPIDSDDKYIELLKECCKSAYSIILNPHKNNTKKVFESLDQFIDSPQHRLAITNTNRKADPTKTQPRWVAPTSGGDGLNIRKCYNDQPEFSFDYTSLDMSSEEVFLNKLDTLMDQLPLTKVKEKTANKFSKLPVGVRYHDCNLNIGILLQKKISSSDTIADQMKNEGKSVLEQFIPYHKTNKMILKISEELALNSLQYEKLSKYLTFNSGKSNPLKLDLLTNRMEEWLVNHYASHQEYNKHIGALDKIIKNFLLDEKMKSPSVLVLFDSNWIAEGHNNFEFGYSFNVLSGSLKNVCVKGSTHTPCPPTSFTDFVQITQSFE